MGKYYTYKSDYKNEDALNAFSITDEGRIFFYNFDHKNFRESFGLMDKYNLPAAYGYTGTSAYAILQFAKRSLRKKIIREYYDFIMNNRLMDSVLYYRAEERIGQEITRITDIREFSSYVSVHCHYADSYGQNKIDVIIIHNNINNYDDMVSELKAFCCKTKNICANCGSFMVNGYCYNCGGQEAIKEINKRRRTALIYTIVGIVFILLSIMGMYLNIPKGTAAIVIHNILLFVGIGCAVAGGRRYFLE